MPRVSGAAAELLAKRRKREESWAADRATAALQTKQKAKKKRDALFKKAEQYVKEYRQQVRGPEPRRQSCEGERELQKRRRMQLERSWAAHSLQHPSLSTSKGIPRPC
jgi:hypothetical protein